MFRLSLRDGAGDGVDGLVEMTRPIATIRASVISGLTATVAAGITGCGATTTVAASTTTPSLPPMAHFRIGYPQGPVQDCTVDGASVTCTLSVAGPSSVETYTGTVTGTLTGSDVDWHQDHPPALP